jgi:glycosyltransferase involved in cell wall biosynthesis
MKVSLVATVLNGRPHVEGFLDSVRAQTRAPDEVVIVDGGSTDGTFEVLQRAEGVNALSEPGANIARGRNVAVRAAAHDVVAVSDADTVLDADWLARILEPLERDPGVQVVAGFYRPIAFTPLQHWAAAVSLPERGELRPGWMPSSRSLALRRPAWESVGGYPEWLDVGEDMWFNHQLVRAGVRIELAPGAVAGWRVRPTAGSTWRQYARYAEGDAVAGMYPHRHAIRFAAYGVAATGVVIRNRWLLALAGAGAIAYVRRPLNRAWTRLRAPGPRAAAIVGVPLMMAFIDAAKMWGYVRGLSRGRAGRRSRPI